jgi:hypothetical protein
MKNKTNIKTYMYSQCVFIMCIDYICCEYPCIRLWVIVVKVNAYIVGTSSDRHFYLHFSSFSYVQLMNMNLWILP